MYETKMKHTDIHKPRKMDLIMTNSFFLIYRSFFLLSESLFKNVWWCVFLIYLNLN